MENIARQQPSLLPNLYFIINLVIDNNINTLNVLCGTQNSLLTAPNIYSISVANISWS